MAGTGAQPPEPTAEPRYKELLALVPALAVVVAVLVVLGVLAVAAKVGLDALMTVVSGPCFAAAINATTYGQFAGYLSTLGMIASGIGIVSLLILLACAGMNENMHRTVMGNLKLSSIGLLVSAAIVPLTGIIGCAAL